MNIEYVTGNAGKFREAQLVLTGWQLEQVDLDLKEIQASREEIAIAKAKEALAVLQRPLIIEDVSLCCEALCGLPGPYVKDFLRHLGEKGFAELIHLYENHNATVYCIAAFIKPKAEPVLFEGTIQGRIVLPAGVLRIGKYSWNAIFLPDGQTKTFGEFTFDQLSKISARSKALGKLRTHLETKEWALHNAQNAK